MSGATFDTEQPWLRPGHRVDTRSVVVPTGPAALRTGGTVYDLRVCQDEAARRRHQSGGGMRTVVRYSDPVTPSGRAERARARAEVENEAVRREGAVTAEREAEIRATLWRWNGYPLAHDADRAEPRS